jgi:DNA invertase Pin-like site-specific DNA recombinase
MATIRGAAYIRVSTKSDAQLHSFEAQERYWHDAIEQRIGYRLVALYADKGISGKAVNNRKQFLNMVAAAKNGEFDTIFTKSVSRFGRNVEETTLPLVHKSDKANTLR